MHPTAILLILGAVVAPLCALAWHPSTLRIHEPQQPPLPRVRLTCREIGFDAVLTHPDAADWAADEIAKRDPNFLLSWRVEHLTSPTKGLPQ